MTNKAKANFPNDVWTGLSYQYDSILIDSHPDFWWKDQITQEVQALEGYIIDRGDLFEFFDSIGPANSFVGVKIDNSGFTYRELVAGTNITIEHTDDATTISSAGGGAVSTATLTNDDTVTLVLGTPVYSSSAGNVKRARGNTNATIRVIGLASESIASSTSGEVQTHGVVTGTTVEWDAITNGSGGLVFDTRYYLSETEDGKLKATPPTSGYVVPVGVAISPTQLKLDLLTSVLL